MECLLNYHPLPLSGECSERVPSCPLYLVLGEVLLLLGIIVIYHQQCYLLVIRLDYLDISLEIFTVQMQKCLIKSGNEISDLLHLIN